MIIARALAPAHRIVDRMGQLVLDALKVRVQYVLNVIHSVLYPYLPYFARIFGNMHAKKSEPSVFRSRMQKAWFWFVHQVD